MKNNIKYQRLRVKNEKKEVVSVSVNKKWEKVNN